MCAPRVEIVLLLLLFVRRSAEGLDGLCRCSSQTHWSIRHASPPSEAIGLNQTHADALPSDGHERSRCSKQKRTTSQSIQFNISAEWTLLCVGIRTQPMGGRTFVLIYWCTQASVDKTERIVLIRMVLVVGVKKKKNWASNMLH